MKHAKLLLAAVVFAVASAVLAVPISVIVDETPEQDILTGGTHELGMGFPADELISAVQVPWGGHIPCPADYTGGGAVQIQITNLSTRDWTGLVYVADPETTLSNNDGFIADATVPGVFTHAFVIDAVGANTPLLSESINPNGIFEIGETWEFVIQEYNNGLGLSPALLDSVGVAGASLGGPPSSGSIIAIPEPSTLAFMGIAGGIAVFLRRLRVY